MPSDCNACETLSSENVVSLFLVSYQLARAMKPCMRGGGGSDDGHRVRDRLECRRPCSPRYTLEQSQYASCLHDEVLSAQACRMTRYQT